MQDGRDDGVGVEMQIRQDLRGRQRVRYVGLAGKPLLAFMGFGAELGRVANAFHLLFGQVGLEAVDQLAQARQTPGTGQKLKERRR